MNAPRMIHSFPTSHVKNNDVKYFVTLAAIAAVVVYGVVSFLQYINPSVMSVLGPHVVTVFSCTGLIILVNRSFANARKNEKNRLGFAQQVRHIVRNKLQRPITLEQVSDLAAGKTITIDDFQIWMARNGSTTALMTNKRIGKIVTATAW